MGGVPPPAENLIPSIFLPPNNFHVQLNKIAVGNAAVPISYSLYTQVMLILILIDVQYSQKAVFSFE